MVFINEKEPVEPYNTYYLFKAFICAHYLFSSVFFHILGDLFPTYTFKYSEDYLLLLVVFAHLVFDKVNEWNANDGVSVVF